MGIPRNSFKSPRFILNNKDKVLQNGETLLLFKRGETKGQTINEPWVFFKKYIEQFYTTATGYCVLEFHGEYTVELIPNYTDALDNLVAGPFKNKSVAKHISSLLNWLVRVGFYFGKLRNMGTRRLTLQDPLHYKLITIPYSRNDLKVTLSLLYNYLRDEYNYDAQTRIRKERIYLAMHRLWEIIDDVHRLDNLWDAITKAFLRDERNHIVLKLGCWAKPKKDYRGMTGESIALHFYREPNEMRIGVFSNNVYRKQLIKEVI